MANQATRTARKKGAATLEPEDSYPHIPEPKQGHVGHLLAFMSVLAVLGFGVWSALGSMNADAEKPAAKVSPSVVAGQPSPAASVVPAAQPATKVPTAQGTVAPSTAGATPAAAPVAGGSSGKTYTVVAGDTLYGIAQKNKTTVEAIVAANGITDRNRPLRIGEELKLP